MTQQARYDSSDVQARLCQDCSKIDPPPQTLSYARSDQYLQQPAPPPLQVRPEAQPEYQPACYRREKYRWATSAPHLQHHAAPGLRRPPHPEPGLNHPAWRSCLETSAPGSGTGSVPAGFARAGRACHGRRSDSRRCTRECDRNRIPHGVVQFQHWSNLPHPLRSVRPWCDNPAPDSALSVPHQASPCRSTDDSPCHEWFLCGHPPPLHDEPASKLPCD